MQMAVYTCLQNDHMASILLDYRWPFEWEPGLFSPRVRIVLTWYSNLWSCYRYGSQHAEAHILTSLASWAIGPFLVVTLYTPSNTTPFKAANAIGASVCKALRFRPIKWGLWFEGEIRQHHLNWLTLPLTSHTLTSHTCQLFSSHRWTKPHSVSYY